MSHASHPHHHATILLVSALLLAGCANQRERNRAAQAPGFEATPAWQVEQPRAAAPQTQRTQQTQEMEDMQQDPSTQIYADLALLAACGMEAPTVYFEYDSANVRRAAEIALFELGECL
jgi:transcription initiation factor TFIID subunit TAF12